jgi:hypothetical protein
LYFAICRSFDLDRRKMMLVRQRGHNHLIGGQNADH